jgi:hypothetical protein
MRILRDGRVRFSAWTLPGLAQLDFTAIYHAGRVEPDYEVSVHWQGKPIFLVYVTRHRVASTCFAYPLTADELRQAVAVIRDAGNGLERWIAAGLEWTQASHAQTGRNPEALKEIPALLRSVRDLPVAEPWQRQRREREQSHRREVPKKKA